MRISSLQTFTLNQPLLEKIMALRIRLTQLNYHLLRNSQKLNIQIVNGKKLSWELKTFR